MTSDDATSPHVLDQPTPAMTARDSQEPIGDVAGALEPDLGGHFVETGDFEYLDDLFPNTDEIDDDEDELDDALELELFWDMDIDLDATDDVEIDVVTSSLALDLTQIEDEDLIDDEMAA
jgi:hypothetical protein